MRKHLWCKRLRLAWEFRVWPWQLPAGWRYLGGRPTEADIKRGQELADKYGW